MTDETSETESFAIQALESAATEQDGPPTSNTARSETALLAIAAWLAAIHEELKRDNDLKERQHRLANFGGARPREYRDVR